MYCWWGLNGSSGGGWSRARYTANWALRMVRSAHGAEPFMYPVVKACNLTGFQVLNVTDPHDEVTMTFVVVAHKCENEIHATGPHP